VTQRRAEVGLEPQVAEVNMGHGASEADDPERLVAGRELTGLIEQAIDRLPEIYRVVFVLREVQQLSTAEAAECLEVTEDVVKVRLHRGKAMLRAAMAASVEAMVPDTFAFLGPRCDRIVERVMAAVDALPPSKPAVAADGDAEE
jgi:RNA polymerase sigma-70 factor, ECF subfamily